MGTLAKFWYVVRARLGVAAGMAAAVGCGVLLLALVCAAYAYSRHGTASQEAFGERARRICQMTALSWGRGQAGLDALRMFYSLEMRRERLDLVALGTGSKIILAGDATAEGSDPELALDRPGLLEDLQERPADGAPLVQHHGELGRLESLVRFDLHDGQEPAWLYLGLSAEAIELEAWARFRAALGIGAVLALGAGLLVFMMVQEGFVGPMRRLLGRVSQHDHRRGPLDTAQLGELAALARALDQPARRLMRAEQNKQNQLASKLERADEAAAIQLELVLAMVRDLRAAMAAVLAQSEMQSSGSSSTPQGPGWVKGIQQEARRVQELARRILDLLSSATDSAADPRRLPIGELRAVMQELKALRFRLESQAAAAARGGNPGPAAGPAGEAAEGRAEERLVQIKHLRGAVMVIGPADQGIQTAVRGLLDLGLEAAWVESAAAAREKLQAGGLDAVMVRIARCDETARMTIESIRSWFRGGALVALLPAAARGTGEQVRALGCDDYIYAPATRGAILAVMGKYLGFQAVDKKP